MKGSPFYTNIIESVLRKEDGIDVTKITLSL